MPKNKPDSVYQLKVTLDGIRPPIWRRIQVRGSTTLYKLHKILQVVIGWEDYHLHQFIVGEVHYIIPPKEDLWDMEVKNEKRARLSQVAPAEKARFLYEYDFGDSWHHDILVEKILYPEVELEHPVCIKGKLSGPPEDCGGIYGYGELLEAIRDPEHPDHQDMLDWVGEEFDPERFDKEEINRLLSKIR